MTIHPLQIGLKVKALRKTKKMTQEDLAEITGVSWRTISNLERSLALPTLKLIYDLSQHFNISIDGGHISERELDTNTQASNNLKPRFKSEE